MGRPAVSLYENRLVHSRIIYSWKYILKASSAFKTYKKNIKEQIDYILRLKKYSVLHSYINLLKRNSQCFRKTEVIIQLCTINAGWQWFSRVCLFFSNYLQIPGIEPKSFAICSGTAEDWWCVRTMFFKLVHWKMGGLQLPVNKAEEHWVRTIVHFFVMHI